MKKILLIEDDQLIANIYRNKLAAAGYVVETALDGEGGLKMMRSFSPSVIVLDLMLPKMSGVEVIRQIRSEQDFTKLPVIVFSNTYLSNLVQEAWKAGATKCLSKANASPKDVLEAVRHTIGESGSGPQPIAEIAPKPKIVSTEGDLEFQAELRKSFIESLPATLATLRVRLQSLIKAPDEVTQLKEIHELYRRFHALSGNAGLGGLVPISHLSAALEALLKELYEKPKNINPSTLRTVASAIDFLGVLFERGIDPAKQEIPAGKILVVDDEAISRRAVIYALEKAHLGSTAAEDPAVALKLLSENDYDLVFLDVDMPGMNGFELCTKLRNLPQHKKTPVVFVTALTDFDNRTSSMIAGGNDFIAKPFLFIELSVKALIHILRGKFMPQK